MFCEFFINLAPKTSSMTNVTSQEDSSSSSEVDEILQSRMAFNSVSLNTITQAIYDQKSDEEIGSMLQNFDSTQINDKNDKGQTLLYTACRAGRIEIVKLLLEIEGINLGGPQNDNQKSTPLHGANWGGHISIVALLLYHGAFPEENCVTPDGRGLPPSEEGNSSLPKPVLDQLRSLWTDYSEKGVNGIKPFLPIQKPPINERSISSSQKLSTYKILSHSSTPIMKTHSVGSPTAKIQRPLESSMSLSTLPASTGSSKSSPKLISTNNNSPSGSTSSFINLPVFLYETLPKYGANYRRFPYIFYWKDGKGQFQLYDVSTTNKLNNAYLRKDVNIVYTLIKNKKVEIILDKRLHLVIGDKKQKSRTFEIVPRIQQWFWRDDDGTIKAYDEKTNLEITKKQLQNQNSLKIQIGKWQYEIFLDEKKQKNVKFETVREIFTEEDLAELQRWWEPQIPLDIIAGTKKAELLNIEPQSDEWNKVASFFHITIPSKTRNGVLDKATGKQGKFRDCHTIIKIEKIINPTLREHWEHELQMVKKSNNNVDMEYVKLLFHGTSKTNPKIIYEADKGWKISYSRDDSLWGRGLYFALDSIYTHNYTHKTKSNTRKVFLAEVIVGDGIHCEEDSTLREPPIKENGKRYDSVIGHRHDTWIWITYDDARAYPTYLIEYNSS